MTEGKRNIGPVEVFTFEVRPYIYASPDDRMTKTLKVMAQVNGQQFMNETVLPMQPANKTEIQYYIDRASQMLHSLIADYENDIAAANAEANAKLVRDFEARDKAGENDGTA